MGPGYRLSRSDLLPVGSCVRLGICFIRFSAVFRPVFLMLGDSFATCGGLVSLFHGWRMDSYVTVLECLGCVLTELRSAPASLPRIYPIDVCALPVFFAVTLLMCYGTWIPNSFLATVQSGAAVSSGVPQTGLLPVGSRGRLSSGIPRRRHMPLWFAVESCSE